MGRAPHFLLYCMLVAYSFSSVVALVYRPRLLPLPPTGFVLFFVGLPSALFIGDRVTLYHFFTPSPPSYFPGSLGFPRTIDFCRLCSRIGFINFFLSRCLPAPPYSSFTLFLGSLFVLFFFYPLLSGLPPGSPGFSCFARHVHKGLFRHARTPPAHSLPFLLPSLRHFPVVGCGRVFCSLGPSLFLSLLFSPFSSRFLHLLLSSAPAPLQCPVCSGPLLPILHLLVLMVRPLVSFFLPPFFLFFSYRGFGRRVCASVPHFALSAFSLLGPDFARLATVLSPSRIGIF